MEPTTVIEVLDRLAQADVTLEEADRLIVRLAGRELDALPLVFRRLHDSREPSAVHAAARVLHRWTELPLAAALPPALRALIGERRVPDLNRLAAAALLEALDDPMEDAELVSYLNDPGALKREALALAVRSLVDPFAAINTLESLAHFPIRDVLHTIDDLARLGDPLAIALLVPLAHALNTDIAMSAVAALDAMGAGEALGGLRAVAAAHPDPTVRREAALTAERIGDTKVGGGRAAATPKTGASDPVDADPADVETASGGPADTEPAHVWIGDIGDATVLLITRRSRIDPTTIDALTIRTSYERGIVEYAATERVADGLRSVFAAFEQAGTTLRRIDILASSRHLEAATDRTLETGGGHGYAWAGWRAVLGSPPGE